MTSCLPLKNKKYNVLVTRPKHQAEKLCNSIEKQGWNCVRFPTLEIEAIDTAIIKQQLNAINQYDWLIFISANAVNFAVMANDGKIDKFTNMSIAVVGKATGKAIKKAGLTVTLTPKTHFNSEGLLETEQMNHAEGKSFLIIRGKGGREILANSLLERGGKVDYLEVYRRNRPVSNNSRITDLIQNKSLDAISITSGDALNNFLHMIDKRYHGRIFLVPLIVISSRIKKMAETIGFKRIIVSEKPEDMAIIEAIKIGLSY